MPKPQLENGFARISNGIIEALYRVNLAPYEWRVLMFVFRITYGWNRPRKEAETSVSQIARILGLDRRHVQRALKGLVSKGMLKVKLLSRDCEPGKSVQVAFQKNSSLWITLLKTGGGGAPKEAQAHAPKEAHPPAPKEAHPMFSKHRF
ncbi:MAG: replication protein [Deltaproteobacteria bacterium]|nr:replication protein [Deltaproteobacteria bacterium]